MTSGKVTFRRDPMTPHETREMEKAGWRRSSSTILEGLE